MAIRKSFGKVLRKMRQEKGISQDTLAFEAGLDRTFIGRLERDETQPTLDSLFSIAKALKVRASEFILRMER